jgi:hypothetical protein
MSTSRNPLASTLENLPPHLMLNPLARIARAGGGDGSHPGSFSYAPPQPLNVERVFYSPFFGCPTIKQPGSPTFTSEFGRGTALHEKPPAIPVYLQVRMEE